MPNPLTIKKEFLALPRTFFFIVIMHIIGTNLVICNQIIGLTPKTLTKIMDCYIHDPIYCSTTKDWVLLFYNSNDIRQQDTFQYLLHGYNKELIYTKQSHSENIFSYPNTAVIDCFSSVSLCKNVGIKSLPLAIYKSLNNEPISYQGYLTLPGLISFIKTHDPLTSSLASWYKKEGQNFNKKDYSEKQIIEILKRVLPKEESLKQKIEQQKRIEINRQYQNNTFNQQPNRYQQQRQKQEQEMMKRLKQEQIVRIKQQRDEQKVKQEEIKQYKKQKNIQLQKAKIQQKQTQKKSSKQQKKKKQSDFLSLVNSSSATVTGIFQQMGVGGIFLQAISWISYCFFFAIFGVICLVIN